MERVTDDNVVKPDKENSSPLKRKVPTLKESFKKFVGATLPLGMYLSDAGFDTSSSVDFCMDGETWWCVLSAGFIILPEVIVSAYIAWNIWQDRKKKSKDEVKEEDFAILSCIPKGTSTTITAILIFAMVPTMILPFVMLPWLSYKALRGGGPQDGTQGTTSDAVTATTNTSVNLEGTTSDAVTATTNTSVNLEGTNSAAANGTTNALAIHEGTNSAAATGTTNTLANNEAATSMFRKTTLAMIQLKGMEALLQASPQLSLKSYIVIHKLHCLPGYNNSNLTMLAENSTDYQQYCKDVWDMWDINDKEDQGIDLFEVISPFSSLVSLSFSIASLVGDENNDNWYQKIVWFIALLSSIGSRMMVCGVLASWNQILWIVPPVTACVIVLATRKLRLWKKDKPFGAKDALRVFLDQGLLLSYPSIEGLLASASYLGWAIWFYLNGTLIDGVTNTELGLEALSVCIVGQLMCLILAFIALRLGYGTPFEFLKEKTSSTVTNDSTQGTEDISMTNL